MNTHQAKQAIVGTAVALAFLSSFAVADAAQLSGGASGGGAIQGGSGSPGSGVGIPGSIIDDTTATGIGVHATPSLHRHPFRHR